MFLKQLADFPSDISSAEVVSLAYDDPRIKLHLICQIVLQYLKIDRHVLYFDFDTQFSASIRNAPQDHLANLLSSRLSVITPKEPTDVLDFPTLSEKRGLVVIDTLNTMQRLLLRTPTQSDARTASHRSAVLISALEVTFRALGKTLLIMSLTRSRPKKAGEGLTWQRDIVGGRVSRFKSDLILRVEEKSSSGKSPGEITVKIDTVNSQRFKGDPEESYEIPLDDSLLSNRP